MTAAGTFPKNNGNIWYAQDANICANIVTIEAGENISAGEVCYIHLTDGKAYISDTGTANDIRVNGIALSTATSGNDVQVQTYGEYLTSGLTDKQDYYLGAAGAISTTLSGVRIGMALSTTQLFIDIIQDDKEQVGTIKAYSPDITGIPSNNLTAFWNLMDGSTISDAESPLNGQTLVDMNGEDRYLRGADTSGGKGGSTSTSPAAGFVNAGPGAGQQSSTNGHLHTFNIKHYTTVFICKIK